MIADRLASRTRRAASLAALACLAGLLAACGGGGGDSASDEPAPAPLATGRFVDAAVGGMNYACGGTSGQTNASGEFDYPDGATCTFKVGGITVGSALAQAMLTPVALVPGAHDETNVTVQNIVRLLVSLDSDGDPTNGITLAPAVHTALASATLDFALDANAFGAKAAPLVAQAIAGRALVSAEAAAAHLRATLLGTMAGSYDCAYAGASSGNVTLTIAGGVISGSGPNFTLSGAVASSGDATITGGETSNGATFSGSFGADGTGSGTWVDSSVGHGSWNCKRR